MERTAKNKNIKDITLHVFKQLVMLTIAIGLLVSSTTDVFVSLVIPIIFIVYGAWSFITAGIPLIMSQISLLSAPKSPITKYTKLLLVYICLICLSYIASGICALIFQECNLLILLIGYSFVSLINLLSTFTMKSYLDEISKIKGEGDIIKYKWHYYAIPVVTLVFYLVALLLSIIGLAASNIIFAVAIFIIILVVISSFIYALNFKDPRSSKANKENDMKKDF